LKEDFYLKGDPPQISRSR